MWNDLRLPDKYFVWTAFVDYQIKFTIWNKSRGVHVYILKPGSLTRKIQCSWKLFTFYAARVYWQHKRLYCVLYFCIYCIQVVFTAISRYFYVEWRLASWLMDDRFTAKICSDLIKCLSITPLNKFFIANSVFKR